MKLVGGQLFRTHQESMVTIQHSNTPSKSLGSNGNYPEATKK